MAKTASETAHKLARWTCIPALSIHPLFPGTPTGLIIILSLSSPLALASVTKNGNTIFAPRERTELRKRAREPRRIASASRLKISLGEGEGGSG
jgi:hypothetical protein